MNTTQIEKKLQKLSRSFKKETFIYALLRAYNLPKASITRLQKGTYNLSKEPGVVSWKKKLLFHPIAEGDLHLAITELSKDLKQEQRFVIVTDFESLLAKDMKTGEGLDIELAELAKHYDFFLPWAGMEKAQHQDENPADVKAAVKMARLFDLIKKDNPDDSPDFVHGLNVFLSRLLFCFFAEDTEIFGDNQFTNGIGSHTAVDGHDLGDYLERLFEVLDLDERQRFGLPAYLAAFPFVNGGLFAQRYAAPKFTRRSRQAIIDAGILDWAEINPDIFGSMIQAVVSAEHRGGLGMHYTSVPNIMKVMEPLFLNELKEAFDKARDSENMLRKLHHRLSRLKIFDPACGSGNFLIIAYKELRRLEMDILKRIEELTGQKLISLSDIRLSQFYGIELDDFAQEIAKLSLWLAEHQMNLAFKAKFGKARPSLPLIEAGNIVQGNACRLDWERVCPKEEGDEVYVLGNPPYLGYVVQTSKQKEDMAMVFNELSRAKKLDYIACWFLKGAEYISRADASLALVTTNSISQGEQVQLLWPSILDFKLEIGFAHTSFKWDNNAKSVAGVTVAIIGLRNKSKKEKWIFTKSRIQKTENINPYLASGKDLIVVKRRKPLSIMPLMMKGSQPTDGGNLLLTKEEKDSFLSKNPTSINLIKRFYGSKEYIRGEERYCIWIEDDDLSSALTNDYLSERLKAVTKMRRASPKKSTNLLAEKPHRFGEIRYKNTSSIIIPSVSSERRDYIPMGFLEENTVISNLAFAVYDAEPWHISVLTSKMHMAWVKAVGGRLKTDYRYSSSLCYNTFPFPPISAQRKEELTHSVFRILEEREQHPEKTLAQLYDPDKMPDGLREAHRLNDLAVERCYRSRPFESDEERLGFLFKLYEKMIGEEEVGGKKKKK